MFQNNKLQKIFFLFLFLLNINIKATIDYLDTTFGPNANGIVTTDIGTSSVVNGITTNSSGNIITVGSAQINNTQNLFVANYMSNGTLNNNFGTNGIVTSTASSAGFTSAFLNCVTIDANGNIVAAGSNSSQSVLVIRLTPTGAFDSTFGVGGIVSVSIGGNPAQANSISIDSNGNIVLAGTANFSGQENLFAARITSTGSPDLTFNASGTPGYNAITGTESFSGNSLAIDQNAKIVVGGSAGTISGPTFLLARFNANGTLDTTNFGSPNGYVITNIPNTANNSIQSVQPVVVTSTNKIVVSGYTTSSSGGTSFTLARYNYDGSLDTNFGISSTGIVITSIGANSEIFASAIDQNGNIVVTGFSDNNLATARYMPNGSRDTTFGINGILKTLVGNFSSQAFAVTVQASDGRVVVGGFDITNQNTGTQECVLIRYNKNNTDFVNITSIADNSTINTKIPVVSGTSNGTTSPQASVQVFLNNSMTPFATVNTLNDGTWNAGNTSVLPIGSNKIQVNLIENSATVVSHVTLCTVTDNLSEDALFAFNSTSQTVTTSSPPTTFTALPFNNIILGTSSTSPQGTWSVNVSNNLFTCHKTGRYYIHYLGHAGSTSIGAATSIDVATMVSINTTEYVGSEANTNVDLTANQTRMVSKGFVKDMNANDTLSLNFAINSSGAGSVTAGLLTNATSVGTQHAYSLAITRIG